MDRNQSDSNPISRIYDDLWDIVSEMVIKLGTKMDSSETLEDRKYVDSYIDAINGVDLYEGYEYTKTDFINAGISDDYSISYYSKNLDDVPDQYKQSLLENKRKSIIDEYNEPNNYYRVFGGLPPIESVGGTIVNDIIKHSFLVVDDSTDRNLFETNQIMSISSARKLMRNTLLNVGDSIAVFYGKLEYQASSKMRSFLIINDFENIRDYEFAIYCKDAVSMRNFTEIDGGSVFIGNYMYINENAITDSTYTVKNSYLVVQDNYSEYNTDTMIFLTEAKMNTPDAKEGDYLLLKDYLYLTKEHEEVYGLSRKVPIHKVSDYYGRRYIIILESLGYLDELRKKYSGDEFKYIEFLASKKIDIITARSAKAFDILWLPDIKNDIIRKQFSIAYNGSRDYFMSTVYNYYYNEIYEYYENFIGLAICQMALQQTIVRAQVTALNRDFYDNTMIKMLYDAYGVPFSARLSQSTQNRVLKNLNMLIQNKSTNKVIYDIATLLGYHDIQVYKYYLMKERTRRVDDNLLYQDTTSMGFVKDSEGNFNREEIVVNDLTKMYEVYFQKVELRETDYQKAFLDTTNRVSYDEITIPDPLWWDDQSTFDAIYGDATKFTAETEPEIYHKHYNYIESKYLGITISYKLSEVVFENILLLRMILEKKIELGNIVLTFPNITGSLEVSLFDTIVFLSAMICKQYHISGEILTKVSTVLDVIGYMTEDADGYTACDTLGFNFELAQNQETFSELMKNPSKYMSPREEQEFYSYLSILTVPNVDQKEKIEAFNNIYQNIKGIGYFIINKMSEAKNTLEYRAWRDLYQALFITKEISHIFEIGKTGKVATTYMEYLQVMNPRLYLAVMECEDYMLYSYIDHVIYRMEQIIPDLSTMQSMNDANSSAHDYLIKLIKFFKSYTTDMVDLGIQYIFDLKPDNLMKLTELYRIIQVDCHPDIFHMIYSDAAEAYLKSKEVDEISFRDSFSENGLGASDSSRIINLLDLSPINRIYKNKCVNNACRYRCIEKKDDCKKGKSCRFYGYDTESFRDLCTSYINIILDMESSDRRLSSSISVSNAIRSHLIHIGRLFEAVDEFRFLASTDVSSDISNRVSNEISELYQTLTVLNTELTNEGSGLKVLTNGIDKLKEKAMNLIDPDYTDGVKICKNDDYPCMTNDVCMSYKKEEAVLIEKLYRTDNIFVAQFISFAISYGLEDYLILTYNTDFSITNSYRDLVTVTDFDSFIRNMQSNISDILYTLDSIYSARHTTDESDLVRFKEELHFIQDE